MNALEALKIITAQARAHTSDERMVRTPIPLRQGDVYLEPADMPARKTLTRSENLQLAPGSTKGSRHVAEGDVEVFYTAGADPLTGPIVRALKRWTLRHPEHADVSVPSGCYQVYYQRDRESEEIARVRD